MAFHAIIKLITKIHSISHEKQNFIKSATLFAFFDLEGATGDGATGSRVGCCNVALWSPAAFSAGAQLEPGLVGDAGVAGQRERAASVTVWSELEEVCAGSGNCSHL